MAKQQAEQKTGQKAENKFAGMLSERIERIFKANEGTISTMERHLKRYKGEWWNDGVLDENDSKIKANYVFSTVETVAPLLTDNRPIWSVRARQGFMQNHVEAFSIALEYLWDKLGMDDISYRWVKDALIMKIGIIKVRWDKDEDDLALDVVDPRTFFNAPGYDNLKDTPMCGERMEKPMSWIRFKYPDKWPDIVSESDKGHILNMQDWELEEHTSKVYEVWMKDSSVEEYYLDDEGSVTKEKTENKRQREKFPNGKIVTCTKGVLLEERPSPFRHGMAPYVELYDYTNPHEFYGMSEADQIEDLNLSFNHALQMMHKWMTCYGDPTWIVDPNSGIDVEDFKSQLKKGGGVMEAVQTGVQKPIEKAEAPPINQTVPLLMSAEQRLMEEMTGITDVSKGQVGKSQRQSATEISTLLESAYTRTRQRVRNYESSLKRLLYMMLSLMQQFYSDVREFQLDVDGGLGKFAVSNRQAFAQAAVTATDGEELPDEIKQIESDTVAFIKEFGQEDPIYAAFDLTVDSNSSLPMDKQSKANMFLRLLEMAAGVPVTAMPMWKATIEALRIPRGKQIIQEMQEMMQQMQQAQSPQPPPSVEGPLPVSQAGGPNGQR